QALVSILNDILDLSKIESGKMILDEIDFSVAQLLQDVLRIFDIPVREKRLILRADVCGECSWVHGDPMRLRQILINLIGNAVKFTAEGAVDVSIFRPAPGFLQFEIRDTGIGIPAEKLTAIFEPFTQADGSHTRRFGGTGLGLAITRR